MAMSDTLNIDEKVDLPLNKEQKEFLRNPDNFSTEEEFYIFYGAGIFTGAISGFYRAASKELTIEKSTRLREEGISTVAMVYWFANELPGEIYGLPRLGENDIIWEAESLDKDKVEWGNAIATAIAEDKEAMAIWAFRFDEIITNAVTDADYYAKAAQNLFKTPKEYLGYHYEIAEAEAYLANHRKHILTVVKDKFFESEESAVSLSKILDKEYKEYFEEHKDVVQHYIKRKRESAIRFKEKLDQDEARKDSNTAIKSTSNRDKLVSAINKMFSSSCTDPTCPVHGNKSKHSIQNNPSQKQLDSSTQEGNTMADIKKNDKTDKKDELMFKSVTVQFIESADNKAIALPAGMTYKEGRYWLQKIEEEETRTFSYQYTFAGWAPLDAMWAAYRALSELHGFVHIADFQSWFGPQPPAMITIEIDYGVTQQMPWGPIEVSGFSSPLVPEITLVEGQPALKFTATIRNNERVVADKLMKRAESFLKTASIYRGKAIDVDFEVVHPRDFRFDPNKAPKFWDVSKTNIDELILSKSVERLVRTNIWTPIRKTAEARQHQIPLRRSVLLAGSYGVGKTLAARATAKIAQDNGWTFLYLRKLNQLKEALYFAKKYQPCVIFAEDINRIVAGKRDAEMDELFNVIDGVDRKNDEVMLVFTTNDIDEIHPGMIRPGRIDTIITVTPPDAEATERLIRLYGRGLVDVNADLTEASRKLAGQIPAIIREAVERSKLAAIEDNTGGPLVVGSSHLEIAADQMLLHAEFLREPDPDRPDMEVLGAAFGQVMVDGLQRFFNKNTADTQHHDVKEDARNGLSQIIMESHLGNGKSHIND